MRDFTDDLKALRVRLDEARQYLRIDELEARRPQLEVEAGRPDLWDDADAARLFDRARSGGASELDRDAFEAHMMYQMARMSVAAAWPEARADLGPAPAWARARSPGRRRPCCRRELSAGRRRWPAPAGDNQRPAAGAPSRSSAETAAG